MAKKKHMQKFGTMTHREMRKVAESFGWRYDRSNGDDDIFKHPTLKGIVTIRYGKTYGKGIVKDNYEYYQKGLEE
jgi:predicted RNA binding protein YcfA (HicA-like mRNA interferase family)